MEIFLIFVVILLLVLFQTGISTKLSSVDQKITRLQDELKALSNRLSMAELKSNLSSENKSIIKDPEFYERSSTVKDTELINESLVDVQIIPPTDAVDESRKVTQVEPMKESPEILDAEALAEQLNENVLETSVLSAETSTEPEALDNQKYFDRRGQARVTHAPEPDWYERFRKKNPDLEKFIGENILSKVAITILVLGIGFFVKYAIDKNWINEIARVGIGILAGGIVLGFAHRLRKNFSAFSSVLVGGGIAIFYFTIGIGFHQYQLFSQTVAFSMMLLITGFAVFISIAYDRIELAVLSLVGGFATPFMVSTGQGNYQVLFTYILILDMGMLVLSYFKRWNLIKILSYLLTLTLYVGWLESKVMGYPGAPYVGALLFGTCFYVMFLAMNLINNLKEKRAFDNYEISILLSNTFIYYGLGMQMLSEFHPELRGVFSISMGLFNMGCAWFLYKRLEVDRKLIFTMIGLTLTFVSLSGPVQLEGNYITLFWAIEALLLMWLAQRSAIHLYRFTSVLIMMLMIVSLAMDLLQNYQYQSGHELKAIIFNKGFLTTLFCIATLLTKSYLLKREIDHDVSGNVVIHYHGLNFNGRYFQNSIRLVVIILLYVIGMTELVYQFLHRTQLHAGLYIIALSYHLLFLSIINLKVSQTKNFQVQNTLLFLNLLTMAIFVTLGIILPLNDLTQNLCSTDRNFIGFIFHYVNIITAVYLGVKTWQLLKQSNSISGQLSFGPPALIMASVVYLLSVELVLHVAVFSILPVTSSDALLALDKINEFHVLRTSVVKIGFPILWGFLSFAFLVLGLRLKLRHLRIGALVLIAIILAKLFTYDISNASEAGKIIAFIILGIVLLIISFLYQKIKALVVDDHEAKSDK